VELPRGAEIWILILVVVVLFGAKRLPDAARGLGRSIRILKTETKGVVGEDDSKTVSSEASPVATEQPSTEKSEN